MANHINRAKKLRQSQTDFESFLWSILRAKQVCGLKFRRQHPIGPFFADLACVKHKLVVEIDGGYHDLVADSDLKREGYLKRNGWTVIRFSDEEFEDDPESIAIAIANHLGLPYEFSRREGTGSGMENVGAPNKRRFHGNPSPAATASDPPEGG